MAVVIFLFIISFSCCNTQANNFSGKHNDGASPSPKLLPVSFPSKEDTLAYVDALKHSNFSQWRSLEEVAKKAGGGSCTGAINTSVLTALYLLGLFNLCAASPSSCCVPSLAEDRRRRRSLELKNVEDDPLLTPYALPPLLNSLTQNLSTLSLEELNELPQVTSPNGGKVPVHISVVEQVRKLWDSNPRLLSNIPCTSATEAVRSSFISLSGVASGIILAYSIAQLNDCYPDHHDENGEINKIWFFPIPNASSALKPKVYIVRSLPPEMPVEGEDERDDGCARASVPMADGSCEELLSSRVCPYMQWVLLNVETRQGECVPRLCSEGKVFVEQDQLCHDVDEPGLCPENQRLYVTAWGEAVCDCKDGMFFGPDKKCHRIYEQGYCYKGFVLQFHKMSKTLICQEDQCEGENDILPQSQLPFVQSEDGSCYQFGSTGPCDGSYQLGFNIEELEPSCVSLDEAGLLKPQWSYQFSHMTFPSFTDNGFPHFEVSYMILNGSTWELVMRTVGRKKREIREEFDSDENRGVITFIDTREFPQDLSEVAHRFKGLQTGFQIENLSLKDVTTQMSEATFEKPRSHTRARLLKPQSELSSDEGQNTLLSDSPVGSKSVGKTLVNLPKNDQENGYLEEMKSNYSNLENRGIHRTGGKKENKLKANKGSSLDEEAFIFDGSQNNETNLYNTKINITNEKNVQVKTDGNGKDIMVKVLKVNSNSCKWHVSFYSQMPNTSVSYNSSSINTLSYPDRSRSYPNNRSTGDESRKSLRSSLKISVEENFKGRNQMQDENANQTSPTNNFNQILVKRNSLGLETQTSNEDFLFRSTSSVRQNKVNLDLKSKNATAIHSNKLYKNETGATTNISEEIKEEESASISSLGPSSNFRRERNKTQTSQKEFIVKVSQQNLSQENSRLEKIKEKRNEYWKRRHQGEIRRKKKKKRKQKKRKLKKRLFWEKKKNASIRKKNASSKKRFGSGEPTGRRKTKKLYSQKDPSDKNRFQNQSLPEYLKNRGRRQAGPKRRSKLTPGIINAPLLNQCRPGAKRDYNGHCRLKVIPEEKNSVIRRHAKAKYYEPSPPRMKCKEGKRLDSRGVCRATFSGLG